jgi:HEAT repeat protein
LGRVDELRTLALDKKVNENVRMEAIKAMGKCADAHVFPALEWIAQKDMDSDVRDAAQHAIEQIRQRTEHNHDDTQTTLPRQD